SLHRAGAGAGLRAAGDVRPAVLTIKVRYAPRSGGHVEQQSVMQDPRCIWLGFMMLASSEALPWTTRPDAACRGPNECPACRTLRAARHWPRAHQPLEDRPAPDHQEARLKIEPISVPDGYGRMPAQDGPRAA